MHTEAENDPIFERQPALVADIAKEIINCEINYISWTLMHRFNKCTEILNQLDIRSEEEM